MTPAHADANPFATRYIRPGAVAFVFDPGNSPDAIIARLAENRWRGQVVGPHGSGKSTLLATLLPHIEQAGRTVVSLTLHRRQSAVPAEFREAIATTPHALAVIDGFEQLGWWTRRRLARWCGRYAAGLLVTTHRDLGLPTLCATPVKSETVATVIRSLLVESDFQPTADELSALLDRHDGNVREAMFELYDWFERARDTTPRNAGKSTSASLYSPHQEPH